MYINNKVKLNFCHQFVILSNDIKEKTLAYTLGRLEGYNFVKFKQFPKF